MLLSDLAALARRLPRHVRQDELLDAYLVAAGLAQLTDDHREAVFRVPAAVAEALAGRGGRAGRLAAAVLARAARTAGPLRWWPAARRLAAWRREVAAVLDALAAAQLPEGGRTDPELVARAAALARRAEDLPRRLRVAVARLPACFQAFDQRPADVFALARRLPDPSGRPLLVTGVRTSGSYLAPLFAARLRADGHRDVHLLTLRPGRRPPRAERRRARALARRGGVAVLLDDPPVTGTALARAADELRRAGWPAARLVLALAVAEGAELPAALREYPAVLLHEPEWAVRRDLEPGAVRAALESFLGEEGRAVTVTAVAARPPCGRGHVRARYRVRLSEAVPEREIAVEGVGLGYLGAHALEHARALDGFAPHAYGLRDGLLYRDWLPERRRLRLDAIADEDPVAGAVAAYVAERRRRLPAGADLSVRLAGEGPAWEVASTALSSVFGRGANPARVLLTDRLARRLLRVERPALVDGNTDLGQWFRENGALMKVNAGEDRFANLAPSCFDPAFDLAGATARAPSPALPRRLRAAYATRTGDRVEPERWLLYELVHLASRERTEPERRAELRRARARALQRYFADTILADSGALGTGPLCALDVDGVLETEHLGFPALTPASALALRALRRHGFRPLLATGRSVGEVAERCEAYGLAGGAAEYGAAIYDHAGRRTSDLEPRGAASERARLSAVLRGWEGVELDPSRRHSLRAARGGSGASRGLGAGEARAALSSAGAGALRAVAGEGQTDFVAAGADKALAIRALAEELGEPPRLALAVGDAAPDAGLASLAALACAPAHAPAGLRRAGFEPMRRPYQAGLAEAVGRLLGHPPGGCPVCRPAPASPQRRLLLTLLGAQERGGRRIPLRALRLAVEAAR